MRRYVWLGLLLTASPALAQPDLDAANEQWLQAAAGKVAPSVVLIETTGGRGRAGTGGPTDSGIRKGTGPTTGLVVAADGYVITSSFNFADKPTAITVSVPGRPGRLVAKVVAIDHSRMLTLLKIEATGLPVPEAVPPGDVRIGQWAIALGRALDPLPDHPPSMSVGIISAVNRIWGRCLQTDAKVSPVNYGGPLVAADGRVLGILVPASPSGDGETSGFEWYDSGISFAVPFHHVLAVLPQLKAGKDLKRGLLGITPKGSDQFSVALTVNTVTPESTAARGGIKPGDVVIAVDGQPVANQAQAYHILGPKYAGDKVAITVKRGDEEKTFRDLELMGNVPPYRHPFLGILPVRDDPELGVAIRSVYPGSPAEKAGLQAGDRIMKVKLPGMAKARAFSGRDQLREMLDTVPAGVEIQLECTAGDGKSKSATLTAGLLPDDAPVLVSGGDATARKALAPRKQPAPDLPDLLKGKDKDKGKAKDKAPKKEEPKAEEKKAAAKPPETGLLQRTSPARDREYWMYVPPTYDPNVAHGVVIWLHGSTAVGREGKDVMEIWGPVCASNNLIMIGPKSTSATGWLASEAEFVIETLQEVLPQYTVDRQRIVAHGMGTGGQMAYYLAFNSRDLIRGVATSGAPLASTPKDNVAGQRLSFFVVAGGKDPLAKDIAGAKPALTEKRFPVCFREVPDMGKEYLDRATFEDLVRWIETLDRL
ncbi:MAG: PDZ domain-containing protein [Gemmataceae bacterium]|nr:PDZ domain-containing protein [Gemmataceae bacterium]